MKDDTVVACSFDQDPGETVPPISTIRKIDFGETRWILVIEKEVLARCSATEVRAGLTDSEPGNFSHSGSLSVLETLHPRSRHHDHGKQPHGCHQTRLLTISQGKGYADLATLEFLNLIHSARPLMPILGVFDCDPHGIEIMRTYKYGSQRLSHEENARVPGLQWLGVKIDDILRASPPAGEEDGSQSSLGQASQSSQSSFGLFSQDSQGSAPSGKQITTQRA